MRTPVELPFSELEPHRFEQLVAEILPSLEKVTVRIYGRSGQLQGGIDLLAFAADEYRVYQVRRIERLTAKDLELAVADYRSRMRSAGSTSGPPRAARFVLVVACSVEDVHVDDALVELRSHLKGEMDVDLIDGSQLGRALRPDASLVTAYFGREWANAWCGTMPQQLRRVRYAPPKAPVPHVLRSNVLHDVVKLLLTASSSNGVALVGGGGFGKSVLAADVCRHPDIIAAFQENVFWLSLGRDAVMADLLTSLEDVVSTISGHRTELRSLAAAATELDAALGRDRALLVIDDVWLPSGLGELIDASASYRCVFTTRNFVDDLAEKVLIAGLSMADSEAILRNGLPGDSDVMSLRDRCGDWPLLLALCNARIRTDVERRNSSPGRAIQDMVEDLTDLGPVAADQWTSAQRTTAVERTMDASLRYLASAWPSGAGVSLYEGLSVFADEAIPFSAASSLWSLPRALAAQFCRLLHDLSLIQKFDPEGGLIHLHGVVGDYLRHRTAGRMAGLNRALLTATKPQDPKGWAALDYRDAGAQYFWRRLATHLQGAGYTGAEVSAELTNPDWVLRKMALLGPAHVEADLKVSVAFDQSPTSAALLELLQDTSDFLAGYEDTVVASSIANGLARHPGLQETRRAFQRHAGLHFASVVSSDGVERHGLRRVLGKPSSASTVAWSWDGTLVAVGAYDFVRVVDVDDPRLDRQLQPGAHVFSLAFSPSGKTLAIGCQYYVLELDLATGRAVRTNVKSEENFVSYSPSGDLTLSGRYGVVSLAPDGGASTISREPAYFAIWSADNWLAYASTATGLRRLSPLATKFDNHFGHEVHAAAWSEEGYVAVGTEDGVYVIHQWSRGTVTKLLRNEACRALCWTPEGHLIAATTTGLLRWKAVREVSLPEVLDEVDYSALACSRSGWLAIAGGDGLGVRIVEAQSAALLQRSKDWNDADVVAYSSEGDLAVSGQGGTWTRKNMDGEWHRLSSAGCSWLAWSSTGMLATCGAAGVSIYGDTITVHTFEKQNSMLSADSHIVWSPDGSLIAEGHLSGVFVINPTTKERNVLPHLRSRQSCWSADSQWLATHDSELSLWSRTSNECLSTDLEVLAMSWHPSQAVLAVASNAGVHLIEAEGMKVRQICDEPAAQISWKPDGQLIHDAYGALHVFDVDSSAAEDTQIPPRFDGWKWSPSGTGASLTYGDMCVWDGASEPRYLRVAEPDYFKIAWITGGMLLATSSGTISLIRPESGEILTSLRMRDATEVHWAIHDDVIEIAGCEASRLFVLRLSRPLAELGDVHGRQIVAEVRPGAGYIARER